MRPIILGKSFFQTHPLSVIIVFLLSLY